MTDPKPMTAREALAWSLEVVWPDHGSDREIQVAAGLVEHFLRETGFTIVPAIPTPRNRAIGSSDAWIDPNAARNR